MFYFAMYCTFSDIIKLNHIITSCKKYKHLVNMVMDLWVSYKERNFLTS